MSCPAVAPTVWNAGHAWIAEHIDPDFAHFVNDLEASDSLETNDRIFSDLKAAQAAKTAKEGGPAGAHLEDVPDEVLEQFAVDMEADRLAGLAALGSGEEPAPIPVLSDGSALDPFAVGVATWKIEGDES